MKALLVARKSLTEMLREPQLLLLVLALPLLFLAITAATYGGDLLVTHSVQVTSSGPETDGLVSELLATRYADGRPAFRVVQNEAQEPVDEALRDHQVTAALSVDRANSGELTVTVRGDALYTRFYRAGTLLTSAINRYADRAAGRQPIVEVESEPISPGGPRTELDVYAPGMIVFGLLLIAPQTAMLVAREIRWRTLRRLRLTRMTAAHFLGGIALAQTVVAVFQVALMFGAALLMGFNNQGSLTLAMLIGVAISVSAIGQGLLVACFVENDSQAANVGSTVAMLQVFLSGAFYQLPPITIFTLAGHQIDLFDVFPAKHGFLALQQTLTFGDGLDAISFRLGATLVLSAISAAAGIALFHHYAMRRAR